MFQYQIWIKSVWKNNPDLQKKLTEKFGIDISLSIQYLTYRFLFEHFPLRLA